MTIYGVFASTLSFHEKHLLILFSNYASMQQLWTFERTQG